MKRLFYVLLLMPVIASCGIWGHYSRPEVADVAVTEGFDVPSWRSMFADAFLQDLVDTALANNADLKVAMLKVQEAEAALRQSRMAFLPSVSVGADASLPSGNLGADARLSSWELDVFGKLTSSARASVAALEESEAYSQAVRTNLVATLADSYYSLLLLDKELEISRQTLGNWDKSIHVMESLKLAGKSNDVAIQQAKAKRLGLEASAVSIEKNIDVLQRSICTLMGVPSRELARGSIDDPKIALLTDVPIIYLASRPDVRKSEMALAKAFYLTQSSRAALYPSVALSGSLDLSSMIWSAVAGVTQPLLQKGTLKAGYRKAQLAQEEARVAFHQILLEAGNEVADALAQCRASEERQNLHVEQAAALQDAVDKIGLLMIYSTANYLEVLTAQQSLLDAQLLVVQDRFDGIQGTIRLYHALGGGLN